MSDDRGIRERKAYMLELIEAFKSHCNEKNYPPPIAILDHQGRPLLSWRVLLLPQLGYQRLYQLFRLNEPWNSEHNIELLAQIPHVYRPVEYPEYDHKTGRHLLKTRTRLGFTHVVALRGPGSVFDSGSPIRSESLRKDTLLFAEAGELVPWTKPDDITINPGLPPPWLNAYQSGRGFTVLGYLDGSVVNCYENDIDTAFLKDNKQLLERISCLPKPE